MVPSDRSVNVVVPSVLSVKDDVSIDRPTKVIVTIDRSVNSVVPSDRSVNIVIGIPSIMMVMPPVAAIAAARAGVILALPFTTVGATVAATADMAAGVITSGSSPASIVIVLTNVPIVTPLELSYS